MRDSGEAAALATADGSGGWRLSLLVEGMHCGACMARIERRIGAEPGVRHARANLTDRRLEIAWTGARGRAGELAGAVESLGYRTAAFDPGRLAVREDGEARLLLRALAVAGFAAANVMLLSVSVWAGHAQGMGEATRSLFHWLSGLVALPAIAYSGRVFFRSAWNALRVRALNMDVPISLAVLLAAGVSVAEAAAAGRHVYFDSAITLVFFLLVGRYLECRARGRARSTATRLLALNAQSVAVLDPEGRVRFLPPGELRPGMLALAAPGERIGVDGTIEEGRSEIDAGLITGESLPAPAGPGDRVFAGCVNIAAPLRIRVGSVGDGTLLAEIARLVEVAEQRRARPVAIADRWARIYAPLVHLLALGGFLGWWLLGGADWREALLVAVAVLVITCPCALGLAVPAVQTVAVGRLMRGGTLLKSATALERFAGVDTVVFDKTGTLTLGAPALVPGGYRREDLVWAARLAAASLHPLARAVARAAPEVGPDPGVRETPGSGLALAVPGGEVRFGRREWCAVERAEPAAGAEAWLVRPGHPPVQFRFEDPLRPDARETVEALRAEGYEVRILSGDRRETVGAVARELGVGDWRAGLMPREKLEALEALAAEGRRTLMVGDGLNDAPALAAASVSLSPSAAADISQVAADAVFQGARLRPVRNLLALARRADRIVGQNFTLAAVYNVFAAPLALAGYVTPLIAAVAMSASSLAVIGNALRVGRLRPSP